MPNTYLRFLLIFSFIFPVFSKSLNPLQAFELCAVLRDPDVYLYEKIENNVLKIICDSEEAYNFGKQNYNITLENVGPDFCPQLSQSNISTRCCEDTMFLLTSAKQNERWALKIVDSFGKPPGGILFEQIYFYGDINQCYDTKVEVKSHQTKISQEPFKPKFSEISATFKTPKQYELKMTIAACLPESCQPKDIEILVSNGLPLLLDNVGHMQSFTVDYLEKPCLSKSAKISLLLLVVFTLLIFLATLYEVAIIPRYNSQQNSSNQSNKSESPTDNKEKHSKESLLEEFLLCFSLYKNTKNLLKTEMRAGSLPCLNGFRIIFHCSILFGHAYTCGNIMNFHYILRKDYISKLYFFISTEIFLLAVDSFFLTSGIVIAYTTLNTLKLKDGKINWVYFYFHRYWRITPPLVILAAVCVPLFPWLGKGHYCPHYELDVTLYENIWWIKLLYVDNIIGYNFLPWTWDLACNMQLFAISPLFIMSFYKSSKLGLSITSITLLASFIITGHKVMSPNYPLSTIAFRFLLNIYTKPVSRIGPYIIGIVYGYYLSKYDRKIQINKHLSGLFCILAVACILSLYSIRYIFEDIISTSQMMVAIFIAVHRSIWALCLGWIIYDCCTDCGGFLTTFMSWKVFIPLSRLTFIQSIIHPYAIIYFYRSIEYQGIFSEYFVIYVAFASLTISFIISYIGSMAFEAPFSRMESLLWKKEKKS